MPEINALAEAKKIIAQRASDPRAKMFGFSDDLKTIGAALTELERRAGIVAEAWLLLYEYQRTQAPKLTPKIHGAVIDALGLMNDHARNIARRINHGRSCTCGDCTLTPPTARDSRPIFPVL